MKKQVKGTLLKIVVIPIRANKSGVYDDILSDAAKSFITQRILDSIWYPFELYKELYNALSIVEGKENPKTLMRWGNQYCEMAMTSTYKLSVVKGDIKRSMEKYRRFHNLVYNFGKILVEFPADNQLIVTYQGVDRDFKNWYYIAFGWLEKFVELCINKKPTLKILNKSWEGGSITQCLLSWPS
ncbi:MAG: hypothetical protein ACFFBP_03365 [Promethearchaeota archaeon]